MTRYLIYILLSFSTFGVCIIGYDWLSEVFPKLNYCNATILIGTENDVTSNIRCIRQRVFRFFTAYDSYVLFVLNHYRLLTRIILQ